MWTSRCVVGLIVVVAIGCDNDANEPGSAGEHGIPKAQWIERFEPEVVQEFCEPEHPFLQCFTVDKAGCLAEAKKAVHECAVKFEPDLPDHLDKRSGKEWGGQIGRCAGNAYDRDLRALGKFKDTPKCNDASAWGP